MGPRQRGEGRRLLEDLERFRGSEEGRRWQAARDKLPVIEIRAPLLAALRSSDAVVVSGETGSGKTTQV